MTDLQLFTTAHQRTASAFSSSRLSILEVDQEQKLTLPNLYKWQEDMREASACLTSLIERVKGCPAPKIGE